ncbi:hypothetical protein ADL17_07720 [Micromonospora maris]|uniref:Uncharacterized protein n=1 Tax=Micromonospora maris TaxID=1003110 RepID=A0A9X0LFU6_9ACTN|nr:hypothetical protein ADL17_07720 [Micromonospora maris]
MPNIGHPTHRTLPETRPPSGGHNAVEPGESTDGRIMKPAVRRRLVFRFNQDLGGPPQIKSGGNLLVERGAETETGYERRRTEDRAYDRYE